MRKFVFILFFSLFARNPFYNQKLEFKVIAYGWEPQQFVYLNTGNQNLYLKKDQKLGDFFLKSVTKTNYTLVDANGKETVFDIV